jgi:hypothetical protein
LKKYSIDDLMIISSRWKVVLIVMNWSLTTTDGIPVFTLRGFLSGSDSQRLQGATAWVAARTGPLVLDLQQLQGCNARGEHELGICVEYFGPDVVLCVSDPDPLRLSDDRLLGVPRAHLLLEALATVSRLRRQPLLVSGDGGGQPALIEEVPDHV